MKFSELTTDKALDVFCEITTPIANICADTDLLDELKKKIKSPDDATNEQIMLIGAQKLNALMPIVFKKHKSDVFAILGALNEKSVEEIASQNVLITIKQVIALVKDKEFVNFFKSCVE